MRIFFMPSLFGVAVKPSNILLGSDRTVKISDFSIEKLMTAEEQLMTRGAGTQ